MVSKKAPVPDDCIEEIDHPKVRLTDPGTAKTGILLNADRAEVRRIRIDGCLIPAGRIAADWIASKSMVVDVIVELKGTNVDRAVEQIEATWRLWRTHEEHETNQLIGAWVLCSEYPRASRKVARYREKFRASGVILKISTRNGEERDFLEFVPRAS